MLLARGEAAYLLYHRGLTHSILGVLLLPPLLAAGLWWGLGRRTSFRWLCLLSWAGAGLHVAYDVVTPWGTLLLYPISLQRFALDWLFIVDLVTWVLPLLAVAWAWRRPARSRDAAVGCLAALALYVSLSGAAHGAARSATVEAELAEGRPVAEARAFPRLFAPWRWQGLAIAPETQPEPRIGRYRLSGLPPRPGSVERIARGFDDPWVRRAIASEAGQAYLWWAEVPVARVLEQGDTARVTLADLRFDRPAVLPAAEAWQPFSLRFVFDSRTGALVEVLW